MNSKSKTKFWLSLVIFSLTGQVAWVIENMYFNVFIYKIFNAEANSISLMVSASAATATLTTIFMGALSDKLANRKAFISIGYILWGISIFAFSLLNTENLTLLFPTASAAAVGVTLVIILDCIMTFFGSSANDACFNAWLTDATDNSNRGAAEGINSMMPLVAILVVFGSFMSLDLSLSSSWKLIFTLIGIAVVLIGIIGLFILEDNSKRLSENNNYFKNLIYGFKPSVINQNKQLYISFLGFAIFGISIQIFMPYLILYYTESLKLSNYVLIMAPAVIIASIITAFYGRLFDKLGFIKSIFTPLLVLIFGYALLFLFKTTALVFVGSLFMMTGYLSSAAVFGARIRELTPPSKSGIFQGLRIISQVLIPGIIGPFIGARILSNAETVVNQDGTVSFLPNENIFMAALIVAAVVVVFIFFTKGKKDNIYEK